MDKLSEKISEINVLRNRMYKVINKNPNLISQQVLDISKKLDEVLNEYSQLKRLSC